MNQANWNDILGKAKEFGKAVGDVAGEVVDASRQKLDEMKKRRELEECYMKLGRMYYALLQEGTEEEETAHAIAEKAAAIKVMLESVTRKSGGKIRRFIWWHAPTAINWYPLRRCFAAIAARLFTLQRKNKL